MKGYAFNRTYNLNRGKNVTMYCQPKYWVKYFSVIGKMRNHIQNFKIEPRIRIYIRGWWQKLILFIHVLIYMFEII